MSKKERNARKKRFARKCQLPGRSGALPPRGADSIQREGGGGSKAKTRPGGEKATEKREKRQSIGSGWGKEDLIADGKRRRQTLPST